MLLPVNYLTRPLAVLLGWACTWCKMRKSLPVSNSSLTKEEEKCILEKGSPTLYMYISFFPSPGLTGSLQQWPGSGAALSYQCSSSPSIENGYPPLPPAQRSSASFQKAHKKLPSFFLILSLGSFSLFDLANIVQCVPCIFLRGRPRSFQNMKDHHHDEESP